MSSTKSRHKHKPGRLRRRVTFAPKCSRKIANTRVLRCVKRSCSPRRTAGISSQDRGSNVISPMGVCPSANGGSKIARIAVQRAKVRAEAYESHQEQAQDQKTVQHSLKQRRPPLGGTAPKAAAPHPQMPNLSPLAPVYPPPMRPQLLVCRTNQAFFGQATIRNPYSVRPSLAE